jgi:hypothetical protein
MGFGFWVGALKPQQTLSWMQNKVVIPGSFSSFGLVVSGFALRSLAFGVHVVFLHFKPF